MSDPDFLLFVHRTIEDPMCGQPLIVWRGTERLHDASFICFRKCGEKDRTASWILLCCLLRTAASCYIGIETELSFVMFLFCDYKDT